MKLRFAGHETFACRSTWLHKGLNYLESNNDIGAFSKNEAVIGLGVGKNMVLSIKYWIQAFGLIDSSGETLETSRLIKNHKGNEAFDPYLENPESLWLLHLSLVNSSYASIYPFFFQYFFKRKASRSFTESEVLTNLNSWLKNQDFKSPSERTLKSDLKVLIDNYCPKLTSKDTEDSMMNLLTDLNLITRTNYKSEGEIVYELNPLASESISNQLFGAMLIKFMQNKSESIDTLFDKVGYPLALDRERFLTKIEQLCLEFPDVFVYKEDAGLKELQCNKNTNHLDFLKLKN